MRRATPATSRNNKHNIFLSTLSLRRATRGWTLNINGPMISIHALLAESDHKYRRVDKVRACISIHALLAESDICTSMSIASNLKFLSTLSLRRATLKVGKDLMDGKHFYPRSPCGERRRVSQRDKLHNSNFYPRSPCGERQEKPRQTRTETNFYPRSPCGERLRHCTIYLNCSRFLSTLSLRRATNQLTCST